jgi:signal peptidase II
MLARKGDETTQTGAAIGGFVPWLMLPIGLVVFDQLLKVLMVAWIGPDADSHRVDVIGDAIAFEYVENRGAAFGIFGSATDTLAIISIAIVAVAVVMLWREHRQNPLAATAIALIVGGALGNLIDRIFRGFVVDFVAVGWWPRFNLADSAVTIGVLLLLWSMIQEDRTHRTTNQEGTRRADG